MRDGLPVGAGMSASCDSCASIANVGTKSLIPLQKFGVSVKTLCIIFLKGFALTLNHAGTLAMIMPAKHRGLPGIDVNQSLLIRVKAFIKRILENMLD